MSKIKKEYLLSIAESFLSYLKGLDQSSYIYSYFIINNIIDLLKTLANIGYEEKSLEIFSECLKLNINGTAKPQCDFVIITRFGKDNNINLYNYEKLLREGNEVFQQKPKELFKIYCDIIENSLKSLSNKHQSEFLNYIYKLQDTYRQHCPLCIIISALCDCAENLLKSKGKDNIEYVFGMLQKRKKENKMFLCLTLYLLSLFPADNRQLIEEYLTKMDCFGDTNLRHEYHLLHEQEFKKLLEKEKKLIFDYTPLLKPDKMQEMFVDKIIKYSKNIKSEIDRDRFSQSLECDVKQNVKKYLNDLLKFKNVAEAIYIMNLFSGLRGTEKTESDWKNITELGLWVLEQKNKDWIDSAGIELLRLFSKDLFKSEGLQVDDEVVKSVCGIIKKVLSVSKGHSLLKELESNYDVGLTMPILSKQFIWRRCI
jgi:hypothetical protein